MADTHGGELAVDIRGLIKSFGHTRALDGLDLSVAAGSVTGFLGPNGAGKSTAIRVLLGLLRADRGTVRLLGGDPWRDAVNLHRRIAYVPGDVTIWPNLTGMQAIDFLARLRGTENVDTKRRDDLIERFELDPSKKARTYSTGNRQKVAIVAAFSTDSELLILDEPTAGLDLAGREQVLATIEMTLAAPHAPTVLMITHHVEELSPRTDRVLLMREGVIIATGTPDQVITPESLTKTFGCKVFVKKLHGRFWVEVLPEAWMELVRARNGTIPVRPNRSDEGNG